MPCSASNCLATDPPATSAAVIRPENWPPPRISWHSPYLATAVWSACPGLGLSRNCLYLSLSRSRLRTNMVSAPPVANPSLTPESISTSSSSCRGVPMPGAGRRRSISSLNSLRSRTIPGGTPSRTQPTPSPWLEPNMVILNDVPMVFRGSAPGPPPGRSCPPRNPGTIF